jgi:hypothetical protein
MSRIPPAPSELQAPTETAGSSPRLRRAPARSATFLGLIAGAALLTGCAVPDVASMSPNLPQRHHSTAAPTAASTSAPTAATTPAPATPAADPADGETTSTENTIVTPARDLGDLYRGSLTHKLAAGDRTLVIDYWTDADPKTLSATVPTIVKLSAHLEDGDTTHAVKVSRFLATADDGTSSATLSDDRGEFVVTTPYSYGTALTVHPANPAATSVTLSIQFDLLVETVPGSGAFFRQTVLDSVRIALPGGTPTPALPTAAQAATAPRGSAS